MEKDFAIFSFLKQYSADSPINFSGATDETSSYSWWLNIS